MAFVIREVVSGAFKFGSKLLKGNNLDHVFIWYCLTWVIYVLYFANVANHNVTSTLKLCLNHNTTELFLNFTCKTFLFEQIWLQSSSKGLFSLRFDITISNSKELEFYLFFPALEKYISTHKRFLFSALQAEL